MKKARTKKPKVVDTKMAAAHDEQPVAVVDSTTPSTTTGQKPNPVEAVNVKLPAKNASLTAKGAAYASLAGRPSKAQVISAFGTSGYALSWIERAKRLGVDPAELAAQFKADPAAVKALWDAHVAAKKEA